LEVPATTATKARATTAASKAWTAATAAEAGTATAVTTATPEMRAAASMTATALSCFGDSASRRQKHDRSQRRNNPCFHFLTLLGLSHGEP